MNVESRVQSWWDVHSCGIRGTCILGSQMEKKNLVLRGRSKEKKAQDSKVKDYGEGRDGVDKNKMRGLSAAQMILTIRHNLGSC